MNDPTDDLKRAAPAAALEQQAINEARAAEVRTQLARMWSKYRPGRPDERKDIAWSRYLANLVEAWVDEIAGGSALIYSEIEDMPWPTDELGYPLEDLDEWTLWTLYIHPVHDGAEPPWHLWEKTAHAES